MFKKAQSIIAPIFLIFYTYVDWIETEMSPNAIIAVLLSIYIHPMRSFQLEHSDCPSIQMASDVRDVNREFFHLKAWYVYALTNPHPNYLSIFHTPQGITPFAHCLRLFSEKLRGLVQLHYNCANNQELHRITLYNDDTSAETYKQTHSYKNLYRMYRRFTDVRVLVTDGDAYVVFYGCQKVRNKALVGLMVLVRTDVYDRFTPPPVLVQLLWKKLNFNVSQHHLERLNDRQCDCKLAIHDMHRKLLEGYYKEQAKQKLRERIQQQFGIGIRNFFMCVFSFLLWLLGMNKLLDKYVFELQY